MKQKSIIFIVDDSELNLQMLKDFAHENEYNAILASNANNALELLKNIKPDIFLLDVVMPDITGFELCGIIKSDDKFKDIPVIFLTSMNNTENIVKGFQVGGIDYIVKPFNPEELRMRIKTHIDLKNSKEELIRAYETINNKNIQLEKLMNHFEVLSNTDILTGLNNRRFIMQKLKDECIRFERYNSDFSIVIFDIDHFKFVNDRYGHDMGDQVLIKLSAIVKDSLRDTDMIGRLEFTVGRWGGEEFLMLLPNTASGGAGLAAERIRKKIEKLEFVTKEGEPFKVTATFGVAQYSYFNNPDDAIKAADIALYKGKEASRNTVSVYEPQDNK